MREVALQNRMSLHPDTLWLTLNLASKYSSFQFYIPRISSRTTGVRVPQVQGQSSNKLYRKCNKPGQRKDLKRKRKGFTV
jgi:hypothetical protein